MIINKELIDSIYDKINNSKILKAETLGYKQLGILVEVFGKIKELEAQEEKETRDKIRDNIGRMGNQEANDIDNMCSTHITDEQREIWKEYIRNNPIEPMCDEALRNKIKEEDEIAKKNQKEKQDRVKNKYKGILEASQNN